MRIAIIGNSGSGKSTLARQLAEVHSLPMLDLDSIVWEAGRVAVLRDASHAAADLNAFCDRHERWSQSVSRSRATRAAERARRGAPGAVS